MPKVLKTSGQTADGLLLGTIKKYMSSTCTTKEELARSLRMSNPTLYSRFRHPEKFTVQEIRAAIKKLQIPKDEITTYI